MLPIALEILGNKELGTMALDLDDYESKTRALIAALPSLTEGRAARRWWHDAGAYRRVEAAWLPRFSRVLVSSDRDRNDLMAQYHVTNVVTIPNGVQIPSTLPVAANDIEPALLFVGSLGYYPNEDAVRFFVSEVLPKLRRVRGDLELLVVGAEASSRLRRMLKTAPGVRWLGAVASLDEFYSRATAVIVPLRAGGGTRLKVLEAFAKARPVLSTSTGVAGLAVRPGIHFLLADSPEEWVSRCLTLLKDSQLGRRLAVAAFDWVRQYSLESIASSIASLPNA
jgi:glycosyltransferase involved in cell wall biosynthesis